VTGRRPARRRGYAPRWPSRTAPSLTSSGVTRRQEKERAERQKQAKAEHERRIIENELEFMSGFHTKR
jgi:hypothetical protein